MVDSVLARRRANPFVDRYVTTDLPLHDILSRAPRPRTPLVQALIYIEECLDGRRLAKNAINAAELVPLKGNDPELLVLMLSRWAELSCRIGRPPEAEALVNRAMALVSDNVHPEIRAVASHVESVLADTTGNKVRREKILREIMAALPVHSPRRKFYVWELAMFLAQQARGIETADEIRELTWQCNEQFRLSSVQLVQFIDAVETGRVQDATRLIPQIESGPRLHRSRDVGPLYRGYRALLHLMHGKDQPPPDIAPPPADANPTWVQVVRHLAAGNNDEALRLARLDATKVLGSIFATGFDSFNLIRTELAAGAPEGAKRLLAMRAARGNRHYLDSFFSARAALLAGDRHEAARLFADALTAVEYYQAKQRLDFELRLSCELSHGDVIELVRAAERVKRRTRRRDAAPPLPRAEASPKKERPPKQRGVGIILGRSKAIAELRRAIVHFADLDAPLLITGETGTGKDLVARTIHEVSGRHRHPFVPVNCASITETLLESELFGHEKGAFTGAEKANKGLFEEAGKGTILLDEIGDITPRLQQTLLRVLETGEIRAVGSAKTRKISCRIIAATNADLEELAEQGRFRKDLLFRLQRLGLSIPPLRERPDDILALARHFLDTGRSPGTHATVSGDLEKMICSYDWPGNVRELRNAIERMRLMHSDKLSYTVEDLDLKFRVPGGGSGGPSDRSHGRARAPHAPVAVTSSSRVRGASVGDGHMPRSSRHADALGGAPLPPDAAIVETLRHGKSQLRRLDRLRSLFSAHKKLTRSEIVQIMGISPNTATKDLKALCEEEHIERVTPSASTRSHYFVLKE